MVTNRISGYFQAGPAPGRDESAGVRVRIVAEGGVVIPIGAQGGVARDFVLIEPGAFVDAPAWLAEQWARARVGEVLESE